MRKNRLYIPLIVLLFFGAAFYLRMIPAVGDARGNTTGLQDVKAPAGDQIIKDGAGAGTDESQVESNKTEPDDRMINKEDAGGTPEDSKKQFAAIDISTATEAPSMSTPFAASPRPAVLLGDSITQAINTIDPLQGFYVLNKGIIGNTSGQMLDRIQTVVSANPSKVFIMAGTNDLWGGWNMDTILKNYSNMVDILQGQIPDCKVYIQSTLPFGKAALDKNPLASNEKVEQLNVKLRQLAQNKGLVYLDIASLYKDEQGMLSSRYTGDGIHINCQYYTLWLDVLKQNLRS